MYLWMIQTWQGILQSVLYNGDPTGIWKERIGINLNIYLQNNVRKATFVLMKNALNNWINTSMLGMGILWFVLRSNQGLALKFWEIRVQWFLTRWCFKYKNVKIQLKMITFVQVLKKLIIIYQIYMLIVGLFKKNLTLEFMALNQLILWCSI